jgi:hypothetical protein
MSLLQIRTSNDRNGNSRVVWVVVKDGAVVDGEIQGPEGRPARFRGELDVVITVSPTELKRWKHILKGVQEWNAKVAILSGVPCAS